MSDSNISMQFKENYKIARRCASEGIVLLENNGVLPLKKGTVTAPVGKGCFNLIKGGGGSADVYSEYVRSLIDGLNEQCENGNLGLCEAAVEAYNETDIYSDNIIEKIGEQSDVVLVTITRYSGEAHDREAKKGDYYLSDDERKLFAQLERIDSVKNVIVVLNLAGISDVSWIPEYSKIGAVVLCWLPGMEGGTAICDVLCGVVNPSGRLTDTFAKDYWDYPSAETFEISDLFVPYEDDIYVGYRYFETFAPEKVVYPFGYGLSYTSFEFSNVTFGKNEKNITVSLEVKNTGACSGRQVVQLYAHASNGALAKPKYELKGYAKTGEIKPGESEKVTVEISVESLASFDDTGVTGMLGAWVIESGSYEIYVGDSIRSLALAGTLFVDESYVTEKTGLKLTSGVPMRIDGSGKLSPYVIGDYEEKKLDFISKKVSKDILLKDVADGSATMEEFIAQLSDKQLIDLAQAQPSAFPRGTAGVGYIKNKGIVNAQTADGPLGLRKTTPTTCFPCPNLIACTWDRNLQFEFGAAIGFEGISTRVDILLAPGLNIHRNPLCGRNFEYYSEDPVISGTTAAAVVKGVQSHGMAATVKHFAANNKEEMRGDSNSLISERALREIYLKGFEIAIKTGKPWALMTSYNLINGVHPSENPLLLTGVLREEWGYEGLIMSDWRNHSHQYRGIMAGENVKMPYGYPEELALTYEKLQKGVITRQMLEDNAVYVLRLLMKTDRFKRQDFDKEQHIAASGITKFKAVDFTGATTTWCSAVPCADTDGGFALGNMGSDNKGDDSGAIYRIVVEQSGEYKITARIATPDDRCWLELFVDEESVGKISFSHKSKTAEPFGDWFDATTAISLPQGEHNLKLIVRIADRDDKQGIHINTLSFAKK